MFEKDPLFSEVSPSNLEAYREAKRLAVRDKQLAEAQMERELAELDAAIAGMDAARLDALHAWASGDEPPPHDDASRIVRKPR